MKYYLKQIIKFIFIIIFCYNLNASIINDITKKHNLLSDHYGDYCSFAKEIVKIGLGINMNNSPGIHTKNVDNEFFIRSI